METKETEVTYDFRCNNCNKFYQSRSGLWKHNIKCIEKISLKKSEDSLKKSEDSLKKSEDSLKCYNCRFCNKEYNNKK